MFGYPIPPRKTETFYQPWTKITILAIKYPQIAPLQNRSQEHPGQAHINYECKHYTWKSLQFSFFFLRSKGILCSAEVDEYTSQGSTKLMTSWSPERRRGGGHLGSNMYFPLNFGSQSANIYLWVSINKMIWWKRSIDGLYTSHMQVSQIFYTITLEQDLVWIHSVQY